ncbi:permease family-domain-containing protein [Scenedesmus sp. NREL 46B-D3]|nr:permease family-domain-containing protein [Scenedesmus sp. NREL 46B-D3]
MQQASAGALAAVQACAALLAGQMASAEPALAVLNSPNARIPRTVDAALRRSIPAFNPEVQAMQKTLENIAFLLRIPQRKPWGNMAADVATALAAFDNRPVLLAGVPPGKQQEAEQLLDELYAKLKQLELAVKTQQPDFVGVRIADSLKRIADLELLQAPGLSFILPREYVSKPHLVGRAIVELVVEKADGSLSFVDTLNGGLSKQGKQQQQLQLRQHQACTFDPLYRLPLDVQSGELPVLPLSIAGAVSMTHLPDTESFLSGDEWFIYKFDKQQAGLSGLSFDEGTFGVFGYVTDGMPIVSKLATGDMIVSAKVVSGLERLTYLTLLGSTVLIPFICVPPMGGSPTDLANVICTIFFVSGIITLLQTFIGDRLPIVQGGSFAYISPFTMREVQGGIIGSGLIVMAIGLTGIIRPVLRAISPSPWRQTSACWCARHGLALYSVGFPGVAGCPQLGLMQIGFVILFSQYLKGVAVPMPGGRGKLRVFELFPVLLGILFSWFIAWLLTIAGTYDSAAPEVQAACRTDQSSVLYNSPWFRFPYPGQWGPIHISWASTLTMLAGALPAMVESLGDYFAAADIAGAPVPPPGVISRAIALQGATCALAGVWGTTSGTTAYNENIGAMQITRVGSRRVIQLGAVCAIIMGLIGKFGGLFASLPNAMVSGLFCVMFGCICAAVGLAQMQFADQRSNRNIFILGFSLYMGLSIPFYFGDYTAKHGMGPIQTSSLVFNNIFNSIFHTAAAVALLLTLFLDNTIPGSDEERGLHVWTTLVVDAEGKQTDWWEDEHLNKVYGLPFNGTRLYQPTSASRCGLGPLPTLAPPARGICAPAPLLPRLLPVAQAALRPN